MSRKDETNELFTIINGILVNFRNGKIPAGIAHEYLRLGNIISAAIRP